jgi:hypothetical protein
MIAYPLLRLDGQMVVHPNPMHYLDKMGSPIPSLVVEGG